MAGRRAGGGESRRYPGLRPGEQRRDLHFRAAAMCLRDLPRRQLEVNLTGQPAVTRAILQASQPCGAARPVNVTKLFARRHPYLGRLLRRAVRQGGDEDALRRSWHTVGIQVSVVSPGRSGRRSGVRSPARASAPWPTLPTPSPTSSRYSTFASSQPRRRGATARPSPPMSPPRYMLRSRLSRGPATGGADVRRVVLRQRGLLLDSVIDGMFRPSSPASPAAKGGATCLIATATERRN
ncbi:hypothetical protein ACPA9J_31460 [Pseudomonas aeruginosa]